MMSIILLSLPFLRLDGVELAQMDQVEEIKTKVDVVELVGAYVNLKQAGRNFKGLCPFHQEKSPSFMVNPELGIYKCFGCGKGGDVISFVQEIEGVEFKEAMQSLAERAGIKLTFSGKEKTGIGEKMVEVNEAAVEYYHYLLTKHKVGERARLYLKERGVSEKIIENFRLGFALSAWDGLSKYLMGKRKYEVELLEKSGLVIKKEGGGSYDRFRDRIIFPLMDHRGKVVGLAGRLMPGADEKSGAKYINSPETEIYHKSRTLFGFFQAKQAIREKDRVVLVEGEMDMISSFMAGVGETVAVKGTALTEDQLKLIGRLTKNLILALDADGAGQEATKRSIEMAEKQGFYVRVVQIKGGKDPDDVAREVPGKWKKMIEGAMDVYEYYLARAVEKYGEETVEGKRKISEEVIPVVARIENEVIKAHFAKKLARILETETETVMAEMRRVGKVTEIRAQASGLGTEAKKEEGELGAEVQILALMMRVEGKKARAVAEKLVKFELGGVAGKIVEKWLDKGEVEVAVFIKKLPTEIREMAELAYLSEVDEQRVERDLDEVVAEWEKRRWKKRLMELQKMIEKAEKEGNEGKVQELQEKVVFLGKKVAQADLE